MEEQLTPLLTNILVNNQICHVDMSILEKYYQQSKKKKYLGNSFEDIYDDMREFYNINLRSLRYGYNNQDEQTIYKSLILAVVNETDTKKKIKLIPLIIYLDNNRFFYNYLFKIKYFDDFVYDIKDLFVGTISSSGVKVNNIEELSPYHQEKEWFESYKKGIENLNFKQIYGFIEGVERGFGHRFDLYVDFLIFIAYKYFFEDLVKIANNKKDMFEIIYLTNILNIEETLNIADKSNNYLLKFESIRKAVYFNSNNNYCLNLLRVERNLLKNIIVKLSKDSCIWQQFLDYYLEYPLRSIQLFEPMSKTIVDIDSKSISSLIQTIKIDKYINDNSKEALNSLILNIKNDVIQKEILKKIFYRWDKFLDNYNEYFGSIILTDVMDIVIYYIQEYLDKDTISNQLKKYILNIQEIDNKWFANISEQNNYFYKQISKIFVYSWAIDKYDLEEYKFQIQNICNNSYLLKKEEAYSNEKTTLKLFNEYILGVNDE